MHLEISSFTGGSLLRGSLAEYSSLMTVLQELQFLIRLAADTARNLLVNPVAVMSGDYETRLLLSMVKRVVRGLQMRTLQDFGLEGHPERTRNRDERDL